jgi:hypothetical protein
MTDPSDLEVETPEGQLPTTPGFGAIYFLIDNVILTI